MSFSTLSYTCNQLTMQSHRIEAGFANYIYQLVEIWKLF